MTELIKQVEDAINKLVIRNNSNSGNNSGSSGGGYSPTVPSASSDNKPEEKKNEDTAKKPETQKPDKDKKPASEVDIKQDETPQGDVSKKVFSLPSSKKLINLSALKGLDKTSAKTVKLTQNKAKVDVSIASDALHELVSKKVTSFAIAGKNFTVNLNSKNIKALSKLKGKQITLKVNKLKSGKFNVNITIDGKKLSAKEVAKLKIKVK